MAKKKKSKLKKFLKGAALAGAAALGAKALMGNKARNAMLNSATADDGFGFMTMKDYGPFKKTPIQRATGMKKMEFPAGDYSRIQDYMAKGGRVGCGVAKRGFGRAMKKGRKK